MSATWQVYEQVSVDDGSEDILLNLVGNFDTETAEEALHEAAQRISQNHQKTTMRPTDRNLVAYQPGEWRHVAFYSDYNLTRGDL